MTRSNVENSVEILWKNYSNADFSGILLPAR
jgi:hypothetical protein